jgi:hypothetical protein
MNELIGILGILMFLVPFAILLKVYLIFLEILALRNNREYNVWSEFTRLKFIDVYNLDFFPISFILVNLNKIVEYNNGNSIKILYKEKYKFEYMFWGVITFYASAESYHSKRQYLTYLIYNFV